MVPGGRTRIAPSSHIIRHRGMRIKFRGRPSGEGERPPPPTAAAATALPLSSVARASRTDKCAWGQSLTWQACATSAGGTVALSLVTTTVLMALRALSVLAVPWRHDVTLLARLVRAGSRSLSLYIYIHIFIYVALSLSTSLSNPRARLLWLASLPERNTNSFRLRLHASPCMR